MLLPLRVTKADSKSIEKILAAGKSSRKDRDQSVYGLILRLDNDHPYLRLVFFVNGDLSELLGFWAAVKEESITLV